MQTETQTQTHTPGPWRHSLAFANNQPDFYAVHTGKWGQPAVAECHNECDAALIAAAPELLDVLHAIQAECEDSPDGLHEVTLGVIALKARQAIAKALPFE